MQLANLLTDYIHAAFTGLWVQTHEADEAQARDRRAARIKVEGRGLGRCPWAAASRQR